tara:strand:+ start:976 stop:1371 length:396 start_codon:yes stop_codon:yes gene_type:complete
MKDETDKGTQDLFEKPEVLSKDMQLAISKFIKQLVRDQISTVLNERELTFSKFSIEKLKELLLDYDSGNLITAENFADEIYAHDIVTADNFSENFNDHGGVTMNDLSLEIKTILEVNLKDYNFELVRKETK